MYHMLKRARESYRDKAKQATKASRLISELFKIKGMKDALVTVNRVVDRSPSIKVESDKLCFELDSDEGVNAVVKVLRPVMPNRVVKQPTVGPHYEYYYGYQVKFGPDKSCTLQVSHSWFDNEAAK